MLRRKKIGSNIHGCGLTLEESDGEGDILKKRRSIFLSAVNLSIIVVVSYIGDLLFLFF